MSAKRGKTPVETPSETLIQSAPGGSVELMEAPVPFFGSEVEIHEDDWVTVSRLDERSKQWVFQFKLTPDEVSEGLIQEYRGGGRYRVLLEGRNERGQRMYRARRQIELDGPPKPLTVLPGGKAAAGAATSAAATAAAAAGAVPAAAGAPAVGIDQVLTAGVLDFLRLSRETTAAAAEAMNRVRAAPPAEDGAMTRVLDVIVQNQAKSEAASQRMFEVLLAMVNKPAPAPPDTLGLIEKVVQIVKPSSTIKDQLDSLNSLYDLKERINPEGEPEDPIVKMVETNLPKVLSVIEKMGGPKAPVVTPKAPAPGSLPPRAGAAAPTPAAPAASLQKEGEGGVMWQVYVTKKLPILLRWAARDKNARVLAAAEYELLPDEIRGPFRAFLAEPGAIAKIVTLEPQFAAYSNDAEDGWLDLFVDQLMLEFGLVEDEEGEESDEEPESDAARAGSAPAVAPTAGAGAAGAGAAAPDGGRAGG